MLYYSKCLLRVPVLIVTPSPVELVIKLFDWSRTYSVNWEVVVEYPGLVIDVSENSKRSSPAR